MQEIKREQYLKRLIDRKGNGSVKIVTGIRRCGKSYLLFTLFKNHLLATGVPEDRIISLALDEKVNAEYRNSDNLYRHIKIIFGRLHYNKKVSEYKDYKRFFNETAQAVNDFCKAHSIAYHIKTKTITEQ